MSARRKRLTQREIGFIQGVAWAAGFVESQGCHIAPDELILQSGIELREFRHAAEYDLDLLRTANPDLKLPKGKA
ncbi:hypothetical protein [Burkholderia singularis]|uniref:hypothetical protein n=1 Tax=Burkholderia singularis TaxID=1503053 RepID=UPI000B786275|nr:hypothetical protein [Burkholderia singularis]